MTGKTWREIKATYPIGARVTGMVKVKFQHGVFLELDGAPEVRAFVTSSPTTLTATGRVSAFLRLAKSSQGSWQNWSTVISS